VAGNAKSRTPRCGPAILPAAPKIVGLESGKTGENAALLATEARGNGSERRKSKPAAADPNVRDTWKKREPATPDAAPSAASGANGASSLHARPLAGAAA